jgi:G3E family GTPase
LSVLGGYLGAGKTTLLNELLADAGDQRLVVVVNDFGSVNVDADLVRSKSEDTLELSNGCVCCSIADGMATVIEQIRTMDPPPDRVLVEVSGVGDPATVAGWGDHPGFRRSAVLVCADVQSIRVLARDRWVADTILRQLSGADLVLLTKTDLADAQEADEVARWLGEKAPRAVVVRDRKAVTDLLDGASAHRREPGGREEHAHEDLHSSWTVQGEATVRHQALVDVLREVAAPVVRVKGVVAATWADHAVRRTLVNVVGDHVEITDDGDWSGADGQPRLVVITSGPTNDTPPLVARLRDLLDTSDT